MASGVCVARCQPALLLFRMDYRRLGLQTLVGVHQRQQLQQLQPHRTQTHRHLHHLHRPQHHHLQPSHQQQSPLHRNKQQLVVVDSGSASWSRRGRRYSSSSSVTGGLSCPATSTTAALTPTAVTDAAPESDVTVRYVRGLPHVIVPLPSRSEKCQFTLRPVSHSVGDFLDMLRAEDKGIDRATIVNEDGVRIAAACSIENLMDEPFWLHVNDKRYHVQPPKRAKLSIEDTSQIGDVRALVSQLYEALHVEEHQIKKEQELATRLEQLTDQLMPYETVQKDLALAAERKTELLTWVGLGMMGVQFGILARLTWWEYSWDIMEPVTYFVTYGTAMAAYAYYCLTKQEYNMPDVKDRQYLITMYKKARKHNFDVDTYNLLKRELADVETDLRRLRDPLYHRYSNAGALAPISGSVATTLADPKGHLIGQLTDAAKPRGKIAAILDTAARKFRK